MNFSSTCVFLITSNAEKELASFNFFFKEHEYMYIVYRMLEKMQMIFTNHIPLIGVICLKILTRMLRDK